MNSSKTTPKYIRVKQLKDEEEEEMLKTGKEKPQVTYRETIKGNITIKILKPEDFGVLRGGNVN